MHLPHCPSPSVNGCVSHLFLAIVDYFHRTCCHGLPQVSFSGVPLLLVFSLSFSVSLSVCLPLSRSLFLSFAFYLPCVSQSQTSWLWMAFFLPLWGLTSHSHPWVFLPEGSWVTEVWRVGSQMDADMLGMRVCDRAWLRGVVDQPQLSLTNTKGVRCVFCCYYY